MSNLKLYIGNNDNLIEFADAYDSANGVYLNAATVTAVITDSTDTEVTGSPVVLSYVSGSNGKYQGILDKAAALVESAVYTVTLTFSQGGIDGEWTNKVAPQKRAA